MATIADINSFWYLDVLSMSEGEGQSLRLEVSAQVDHEDPRLFEIVWRSYLVYQVLNESFSDSDEYDEYAGRRFVKYSKSRYLDFVKNSPSVRYVHAGSDCDWTSITHWGLFCLNHIIDVVSNEEPMVRELEPPWEKPSLTKARFEEMLAKNREESIAATERERKEKAERERGG